MHIRKLDIFIAKQFGLLFMGTFFICLFVLMMQFLWRYVDDLIGKGLTLDILAQFFWYMGLMLIPQAFPLAILLSSLITFGNLGESSELTAIKASGISLMQAFRPLIVICTVIMGVSFVFQNDIGPKANNSLGDLLISMKQTSPELEIPEGVFYAGIPKCNLYVQKKNLETGHLYGIMIYKMNDSFEDAAIILADSGMLQSTADKKHLLLSLWSGEWFENMKSQEVAGNANVPYRRESFISKKIILDFDNGFSVDNGAMSGDAHGMSLKQLAHYSDSMNLAYDSIGMNVLADLNRMYYAKEHATKNDTMKAVSIAKASKLTLDSLFNRLSVEQRKLTMSQALTEVKVESEFLAMTAQVTEAGDYSIRQDEIEAINKFTLSLTCLIFFFIGAPLGAIIRKGGLGLPVIVSVLVFIVFYILDNTGYRMSRSGIWAVWFGKSLAPAVLIPTACLFTYLANKDYSFNPSNIILWYKNAQKWCRKMIHLIIFIVGFNRLKKSGKIQKVKKMKIIGHLFVKVKKN